MLMFRVLLVVIAIWTNVTAWIAIYFSGWNLFAVVASDLNSVTWNAQFDADLICYLILSAIWVAWRYRFKAKAIVLGAFVGLLGNAFFAPYLLFLTYKTNGDIRKLILGENS